MCPSMQTLHKFEQISWVKQIKHAVINIVFTVKIKLNNKKKALLCLTIYPKSASCTWLITTCDYCIKEKKHEIIVHDIC